MIDTHLTVILPAAGSGTRLSLPYSKEVLFTQEKALIDYSFDLFNNVKIDDITFVVVINENKTDIVKHLSKYKDKFNISFIFQNPNMKEYTGAVKSAKFLIGNNNLVLLPDSVVLPYNNFLHRAIIEDLSRNNFGFLYKQETNTEILKTKGCIKIENKSITMYEDKPTSNLSSFSAFWGGFYFKKCVFDNVLEYMHKSTLKEPNTEFNTTEMFMSTGIELKDYIDLGTWPEYRRFIDNY